MISEYSAAQDVLVFHVIKSDIWQLPHMNLIKAHAHLCACGRARTQESGREGRGLLLVEVKDEYVDFETEFNCQSPPS